MLYTLVCQPFFSLRETAYQKIKLWMGSSLTRQYFDFLIYVATATKRKMHGILSVLFRLLLVICQQPKMRSILSVLFRLLLVICQQPKMRSILSVLFRITSVIPDTLPVLKFPGLLPPFSWPLSGPFLPVHRSPCAPGCQSAANSLLFLFFCQPDFFPLSPVHILTGELPLSVKRKLPGENMYW